MMFDKKRLCIAMPLSQWDDLSNSINDVLCWANGFKAAHPEGKDLGLYGLEDLREFNIIIKQTREEKDAN